VLHAQPISSSLIRSPNNIWISLQVTKSLIMQSSPATYFLSGPNILLRTLFSNTLTLCLSLSVRDQVSHQYKTTAKTMIMYILIFKCIQSGREDRLGTEWQQEFHEFNLLLNFFVNVIFIFWVVKLFYFKFGIPLWNRHANQFTTTCCPYVVKCPVSNGMIFIKVKVKLSLCFN